MHARDEGVSSALTGIGRELESLIERVALAEATSLTSLANAVSGAPRIFVVGAGRSGLALRMTAMRLMHLGHDVHVVGEVTSPAISAGDLLLTASGSGTTSSIVRAAQTARTKGATVAAITTASESPLADLASVAVIVPAADKLDRSGTASWQYAGSLFEQAVMLLGDAVFQTLWKRSGVSADELWPRHANLE